jgi:hypothetical protein
MTQKASVRWQETLSEGWKIAGPDHPIYSEGPSITFLRRTPKQSQQKDIVFPQTDSPSDLEFEPDDESDDDSSSAFKCPYCQKEDSCEHLLLLVNLTFRNAGNGALFDKFEARWREIRDEFRDEFGERYDFDEGKFFDELLDDVSRLSDAENFWDFEGGPGQSCSYHAFYCQNDISIKKAIDTFYVRSEEKPVSSDTGGKGE